MQFRSVRNRLMIACAATTLTLAGCDKADNIQKNAPENAQTATAAAVAPPEAALPLAAGAAPTTPPAPIAAALPPAPPLRYEGDTGDRYAYLDRAYTAAQAFGDAPPDYTYAYEQQQPLAWRSDDGYQRVAEPLPDGGLRYYYYQPGAQEPYLVQDPDFSYGYSDGVLTVVYNADGAILPDDLARRQADTAARYLSRARALYAASVEERHEAVAQAAWNQQQERIYADQQRWRAQQDRDAAWHSYHDAHLQNEQAHWAMERYRRAAEATRFAQTINDAVIAARAAQALSDASAEARRYGHNVPSAPAPSAHPGPAAPDHASPGPAGAGAQQRPGPEAQRQGPAPDANSRPPNPSVAPAQPTSQPSRAPTGSHAGEPGRPNNKQMQDTRGQERAATKPPARATPAGIAAKAPIAATPAPQHAGPTVSPDHARTHAPQDRPRAETKPATAPKVTTVVTPPPAAVTKPVVLPAPQHAMPATVPSHAERTDQKPNVTAPAPKETPAAAAPAKAAPPAAPAPAKGAAQPVAPAHAAPAKDDHKHPHLHEKKQDEPASP